MRDSSFIRILVTALFVVVHFALHSCAAPDDDVLVVYSAGPRGLAEAICAAFAEETGVRVELFSATTGQIMAKLEAERYNARADVVILASQFAAEWLKREGRLQPYRPAALDAVESHEHWHDPDSQYHATSAAAVGIAVRDDFAREDMQWHDLFHGNFDGRSIMPAPSRSGSSADFVLTYLLHHGERGWDDFLTGRAQGLEIAGANSQAITNLLIGSHQAILGAVDYLIYREIARGESIIMHYPPSGAAVVTRPIAILRTARRPDHARRFVDFYFTDEAQKIVASVHLQPALRHVPVSEARRDNPIVSELSIDLAEAMDRQRPILRRFQYEVERAVITRAEAAQ